MTRRLTHIITIILLFSLSSCTGRSSNIGDTTYADGYYIAAVKYHNPKTGTRSTYTLRVRVKDNKLVTLFFSNGGWLDDSYFTPPKISKGKAKFKTDRNYEYVVTIINNINTSNDDIDDEEQRVDEDTTCPLCGRHKYSIDEYCVDCQEEEERSVYNNLDEEEYE